MKQTLFIIILVILLLGCNISSSYPEKEWTIMFYMSADFNQTLDLQADINELTYKITNTSNINITILYDGPKDGDAKLEIIDSPMGQHSRIIELSNTDIPTIGKNELNMATEKTLYSYITYVKSKAPAKNYALFFGSHGTGYTKDLPASLAMENNLYDNNYSPDEWLLTIPEINSALTDTGGVNNLVFDACLMGNIENIYEFNGNVEYIVASPEEIPGNGNYYVNFINNIYSEDSGQLTPFKFGELTIKGYYNYYKDFDTEENTEAPFKTSSRLNMYDVEKISTLVESSSFRTLLPYFKEDRPFDPTLFNSKNYTDIYSILNSNPIKYQEIITKLNNTITKADEGLYKWLSIYIPNTYDYNDQYKLTDFAKKNPDWVDIIKN